jgi:hypothetical protein
MPSGSDSEDGEFDRSPLILTPTGKIVKVEHGRQEPCVEKTRWACAIMRQVDPRLEIFSKDPLAIACIRRTGGF